MNQNKQEYLESLCHSLAKATNIAVRLFQGENCLYYYSVYHLHPDPAEPFLKQLLDSEHKTGVITTPLYQFYGFLTISDSFRIVIGPSRMENDSPRLLAEQLFLLNIPPEQKASYTHILHCFPVLTAERMGWLIAFLAGVTRKQTFSPEELYTNIHPDEYHADIQKNYTLHQEDTEPTEYTQLLLDNGYRFEKLILSYIEQGEPDRLQDLLSAPPPFLTGKMSYDTLRQIKDTGICGATIASRAAIAGGLDSRTAFRMSDLYIQKTELLQDSVSLHKLCNEMFVDFAKEVARIRYHTLSSSKTGNLFRECVNYVSQNIYAPIRTEELANTLGYTRSYLCSCFKKQTGMTLSHYILQEKIFEAQRMLRFTDKSLSEIAALLAFSSQSHFQNVYKKLTGETPAAYRQNVR